MRVHFRSIILALALGALPVCAAANVTVEPGQQTFAEGDLKLESGEVIHDFHIAYVTRGTLNAAKSNAILMTSSLAGNHHRIDFLIGPGKAYDPAKYFVICTDAIGNGLSTSPSNSATQHGTAFPHYTIRDMISSQFRLVTEHYGIRHLAVVTGASMGGMQSLQWAVSHPLMMDRVVAITPLAHTPAWTLAITRAARMAFTLDPAFANGNYTAEPEGAWRLQSAIFDSIATRTPVGLNTDFAPPGALAAFATKNEDARVASGFDANDWISQTWAYDRHNVGDTGSFHGDTMAALGSVKAKTLILQAGLDLLNPVDEGTAACKAIPGCTHSTIPSNQGHSAGGPSKPADVDYMNATIESFLNDVTIPNS